LFRVLIVENVPVAVLTMYTRWKGTAGERQPVVSSPVHFRTLQNAVVLVKTNSIRQVPGQTGSSSDHIVTMVVLTELRWRKGLMRMR
jgi:hypothetical protein